MKKTGWADRMHNGKKITVLRQLPGARDRAIYSESDRRHSRHFSSTEVLAHQKRPSGKVISDRFFPPVKGNTSQANPKVPMKFPKNDLTIYFPTEIPNTCLTLDSISHINCPTRQIINVLMFQGRLLVGA